MGPLMNSNWRRPVWYLKLDLANFFVSIDKRILREQLAARITEPWWLWLSDLILFHDPRQDFELRGAPALLNPAMLPKRVSTRLIAAR